MSGTLYVVATPIGNLEDITLRALRVLGEVDVVACEDTRRTRALLSHFELSTPTVSYHDHNARERAPQLVERLERGESIALVSDAGTPTISDPGYRLVSSAAERAIPVVPIPGASAAIAALSAAGLPTDAFLFAGFLPPKGSQRRARLDELSAERATLVFYEAPHRIARSLADMLDRFGDREAVLARELTKVHEEFIRGPLSRLVGDLPASRQRGEFVVLVAGASASAPTADETTPADRVAALEASGVARKEAIKQVARERGLPKREVYRTVMEASRLGPEGEDA